MSPELGEIFKAVIQGPETKKVISEGSFLCAIPGKWNSLHTSSSL